MAVYKANEVVNSTVRKEAIVEDRVERLEKSMHKVDSEIQMMNKTMRDIADTLKEIKDDQKKIQTFEVQKALLERDVSDMRKQVDTIFKKLDNNTEDVQVLKETNAGSAVKINNSERLFWLFVTSAIGAISFFTKGS